ncbi:MAG: translation initiation factor IF-2 [Patescibacteria group bacterium]
MSKTSAKNKNNLQPRPPIVVVAGHIDHGKSTLLDYIRQSSIVAKEAGGITQHLGAYEVKHKTQEGKDRMITFLDTPGHEDFGTIRIRGANLSDIAILIISAEEGVKPQTIETIKVLKETETPFLVAFNKIDRPTANPEKIKQELAEQEVLVESWGGDIPTVEISAKTGQGIDNLLEVLCLMADMAELTTNPLDDLQATVIETHMDPQTGPTITAIITDGTLQLGQFIGANGQIAKIKKIENDKQESLTKAEASTPVKIFGFSCLPIVGSNIIALKDKKTAGKYAKDFKTDEDSTTSCMEKTEKNLDIPIIIKADTAGCLEAIIAKINKINQETDTQVKLKMVCSACGNITDNDIKLLLGSKDTGLATGFNVKIEKSAQDIADRYNIRLATFDIIYELTDWLKEQMKNLDDTAGQEKVMGQATILKCFNSKVGKQVAGGQVTEGIISRRLPLKIKRGEEIIGVGKISNLEINKSSAEEVSDKDQFGIQIDTKTEIQPQDIIISFKPPVTDGQK